MAKKIDKKLVLAVCRAIENKSQPNSHSKCQVSARVVDNEWISLGLKYNTEMPELYEIELKRQPCEKSPNYCDAYYLFDAKNFILLAKKLGINDANTYDTQIDPDLVRALLPKHQESKALQKGEQQQKNNSQNYPSNQAGLSGISNIFNPFKRTKKIDRELVLSVCEIIKKYSKIDHHDAITVHAHVVDKEWISLRLNPRAEMPELYDIVFKKRKPKNPGRDAGEYYLFDAKNFFLLANKLGCNDIANYSAQIDPHLAEALTSKTLQENPQQQKTSSQYSPGNQINPGNSSDIIDRLKEIYIENGGHPRHLPEIFMNKATHEGGIGIASKFASFFSNPTYSNATLEEVHARLSERAKRNPGGASELTLKKWPLLENTTGPQLQNEK